MAEPFIAEIKIGGWSFAPRGWAFCDGSILAINTNQALFSLLGTTYGGDGVRTFQLPDLRGRAAMHAGTNPMGAVGGEPLHTLAAGETPQHTHQLNGTAATGSTNLVPNAPWLGGIELGYGPAPTDPSQASSLEPSAVSSVGGGGAHENRQPYTCVNFVIALQGLYPSRN